MSRKVGLKIVSMKLQRKKCLQNSEKMINCPKIEGPAGPEIPWPVKYCSACGINRGILIRNNKRLAFGLTTVLLCVHSFCPDD